MLWDDLGSDTKLAVAKMMEHEANALASQTPLYWANKSGTILTPGDTQEEEDAWSGHMLAVAQAMMPNHPNAALWRQKASQWMVAAYARQSDLTNTALVDGKPVKIISMATTCSTTACWSITVSFTPTISATTRPATDWLVDVSLAGQYATQSMVFNADLEYQRVDASAVHARRRHQVRHRWDDVTPGGTIYQRTAGGGYNWRHLLSERHGLDLNQIWTGYLNKDLDGRISGFGSGTGLRRHGLGPGPRRRVAGAPKSPRA